MTNTLFIRLTSTPLTSAESSNESVPVVDWGLFDKLGNKTDGGYAVPLDQLHDKPAVAEAEQLVAIIPGEEVLQLSLLIPAKQKRHLQRTLPFLVEEHLASPIEEMHLAAGHLHRDTVCVSAVSHARMQHWLGLLKNHQLNPDYLLPAVADPSAELSILVDNHNASIHCAPNSQGTVNSTGSTLSSICTELGNLSYVTDCLIDSLEEAKRPAAGILISDEHLSAENEILIDALTSQLEVAGISIERQRITHSFDYQCQQLFASLSHARQPSRNPKPINLLSAQYRSNTPRQQGKTPNWLALAAVVVICIGVKLLFDLGSGLYLNYQNQQIDHEITALYKDLFPQDSRIVNVKVQMQNHLNQAGSMHSNAGFMSLFSRLAQALEVQASEANTTVAQASEAQNKLQSLQIQQLRYNENNQTLLLDIHVRQIQQLEQLTQDLQKVAINAAILSANEDQQWVKGRLRLTML